MRSVVLMCASLLGLSAQGAEFETPLAITNIALVPSPGTSVGTATIVIEDGRITNAGVAIAVPLGARIVFFR